MEIKDLINSLCSVGALAVSILMYLNERKKTDRKEGPIGNRAFLSSRAKAPMLVYFKIIIGLVAANLIMVILSLLLNNIGSRTYPLEGQWDAVYYKRDERIADKFDTLFSGHMYLIYSKINAGYFGSSDINTATLTNRARGIFA